MKITNTSAGFNDSQIYKVELVNGNYLVVDTKGSNVGTLGISTLSRKAAYDSNMALHAYTTKTGKQTYRRVPMRDYNSLVQPLNTTDGGVQIETPKNHSNVKDFIHNTSISLKPVELVMNDLKWKYLIRSAVRAKNIMMTGPAGCGKTKAVYALAKSINKITRKVEYVSRDQYEAMLKDIRYEILNVSE